MKAANYFCRIVISLFFLLLLGTFLNHHLVNFNPFSAREDLVVEAAETKVTTANLNMRTGPGMDYAIITVIPNGTQVSISGYSGDWAQVSYSGKEGYGHSSYLKNVSNDVRYTTVALNLRTGPKTSHSIILTMPRGSQVSILDTNSAWPRVRYGTKEGYASPDYLSTALPSTLPSTSPSGAPAAVINKGNQSSSVKRIALTFDDSGSANQIRSILNSLESYGARGTFFPNGDFVKNNPNLIREIASRGHSVQSHTYAHKDLRKVSDAEVRNQIRLAQNAVYNATGKYPVLMRPPYGAYDSRIRTIAGQEGIRYLVLWSVDTSDWATRRYGVTITTDYVIKTAVNNASQNGIILMHMNSNKTVSGLPTILKRLRDQGYQFVTVNEMVN